MGDAGRGHPSSAPLVHAHLDLDFFFLNLALLDLDQGPGVKSGLRLVLFKIIDLWSA